MEVEQSENLSIFGIIARHDRRLVFGQITPIQNVAGIRANPVSREQFGHFIGNGIRVGILRNGDLDGQDADTLFRFYGVYGPPLSSMAISPSTQVMTSQ